MEKNLEKLLKQINLNEDNYKYFENGSLDRIIGNKKKDNYHFLISLKETLPLDMYNELQKRVGNLYSNIKSSVVLNIENENNELIAMYYRNFIEKYSTNSPLLSMFKDNEINYNNHVLTVLLNNKPNIPA